MFIRLHISLWIITFIIVGMMICFLVMGWVVIASLPLKTHSYSPQTLFTVRGEMLRTDIQAGLDFLYADNEDSRRIADAVMRSIFLDLFGENVSLHSVLEYIGDVPYFFSLDQDEEGALVWALVIDTPKDTDDAIHSLTQGALSRERHSMIRDRTVPSGKRVRDIVAHSVDHPGSFIADRKRGLLLLGNNEEHVRLLPHDMDAIPMQFLFANNSGFSRFMAVFPPSDVLRYFGALPEVSLSSWRCMSYHTSAFPLFSYVAG